MLVALRYMRVEIKLMIRVLLILCLWASPAWAGYDEDNSLEQAKQAMQVGRYAQALETLERLVKKQQGNYEAWFLLGVAQVHEQKVHQAIEAFRYVIELRPNLAEPHNNLAAVYNNLGDTQAAIHELEIALEKRPNYTIAEENLADLHIKLALKYYYDSLKHGANSTIEKRYARLLRVRNPAIAVQDTVVAQQTKKEAGMPESKQPIHMSKAEHATTANPVKATQQSAEMPEPHVASIKPDVQSEAGVLDALEAWRKAWSSQDLDAYFSAYAKDFKPNARFHSIAAWKAYKRHVIQNTSFIDVQLENIEVDMSASRDTASIHAFQHFRSNSYTGDDHKTITMKYTPQGWKIVAEVANP